MATTARLASILLRQQTSVWARQRGAALTCQRPAIWSSQSPWSRTLSTTSFRSAALAPTPPAQPTITISSPDPKYIEDEEIDVELPPPEEIRLEITDRAAEQLRAIATRRNDPDAALRVSIDSGGCHGYQYKLELATNHALDDFHFAHPTLQPSNVYVDAISFSMLNGSTIDFATELIGSSFRVTDNPKSKGSGCGCGTSWELKEE